MTLVHVHTRGQGPAKKKSHHQQAKQILHMLNGDEICALLGEEIKHLDKDAKSKL